MRDSAGEQIAVGLIVADDGRVLLQHRDDKPGLFGRDRWGFFGGHVEAGERPAETFLREMQEELNWRPRHFEPYAVREVANYLSDRRLTSHAFAAHLDVPMAELVLGEGQGLALFAPDALPATILPDARPVLAAFFASDAYKRVKRRWSVMTTTGLIVDAQGRLLLQHRDDIPGIANPGLWGSFGGELEPYETPQEGFLRELDEELSWRPAAFSLFGSYPYDAPEGRQLIYAFATLLDVPLSSLVLGEGQDLGVFAPDALPEQTVPDLRRLLAQFVASDAYRALTA